MTTESAFPFHGSDADRYESAGGMTLRDFFAAKAMPVATHTPSTTSKEYLAEQAYKIADAMMAERDKSYLTGPLKNAIQANDDLAWTWHCNIAMPFIDEGGSHMMANHAAARFMSTVFGVDVTKFVWWQDFEKQWKQIEESKAT